MGAKKFKPGDWVKIRGKANSPKMEVIKYIPRRVLFIGPLNSDKYLECVFYKNGERVSQIMHQNKLVKLQETGGIYKT